MPDALVDSNVLLDLVVNDPQWRDWSVATLLEWGESHTLVINPIIYAEVSIGFDEIEAMEASIPMDLVQRRPIPWEAAFLAGKCFVQYRRKGGTRTSCLPDFFIGAHAAVERLPLITRDTDRYRTYFPTVKLICP